MAKVLVICPVPAEFNACREVLRMWELAAVAACRCAHAVVAGLDLVAVESGPAKARAAAATATACHAHRPDLVIDSGSCAGLDPEAAVGQVVLATASCEYGIGCGGFPTGNPQGMRHPAAFSHLDAAQSLSLQQEAVEIGRGKGLVVRPGPQACGEFVVQSLGFRRRLYDHSQALGANWESAAVFVAAFMSGVPALSTRVVTDLGDEQAVSDFRRHVKARSRELYGYLRDLAEHGWLGRFLQLWHALDPERRGPPASSLCP